MDDHKTPRRKHRCKLLDIGLGNDFLGLISKAKVTGAPGWLSPLSFRLLMSAQVMISPFMKSSPCPPLGILSPSVSAHPLLSLSLSLSLSLNK